MTDYEKALLNGIRGGSSSLITTASGTYSYEPDDFIYGIQGGDFEQSIVLQIMDAFGSLFEWTGLPDGIESYDLESMLLTSGRIAFIRIGLKNYIVRFALDDFDQNGNMVKARIVEPKLPVISGLDIADFKHVEIKNNRWGVSLTKKIWPYIASIGELQRKLLLNIRAQGKVSLKVDDSSSVDLNVDALDSEISDDVEVNTIHSSDLENELNEWMENENTFKILVKDLLGGMEIEPIEVPDVSENILRSISFFQNQILSALGMPTNNLENKNERVVSGEIELQNVFESSIIDTMLKIRQSSVDKLNSLFNLNISVDYSEKARQAMESNNDESSEEVKNENLRNG